MIWNISLNILNGMINSINKIKNINFSALALCILAHVLGGSFSFDANLAKCNASVFIPQAKQSFIHNILKVTSSFYYTCPMLRQLAFRLCR